ncbi:penicillin-binding protein 2 [Litorivicinus lipolyticus]|uniref:Penicillin-binding protein 2 n=1 Tax=Litorivicinus lipolyticus TaxID=418701 RepID=A0A5Q2QGJ4_9GAMM|nr:penicillin-binding protein 2 [Litorivicinus lipolyticus]QGG80950.1 penicillin-binding protein 2 [Litorivicinus lipolyticus]
MVTRSATPVWRLWLAYAGLLLIALAIVARLYVLQVSDQERLRSWGEQISVRKEAVPAFRGSISDRNGQPLAMSTPGMSVAVDPSKAPPPGEWLSQVADAAGVDMNRLAVRFNDARDRRFMYIRRNMTPQQASRVMDLGVPGVTAIREARRFYPAGEATAHIVGFTDVDDRGREGLELAFDGFMSPKHGSRWVLVDRPQKAVRYLPGGESEAFGNDIQLTLDLDLQYATYKALKSAAIRTRSVAGSAVVIDAKTGEVLAAASFPSFNPNETRDRTPARTRPRFVADLFEPGSAIKPFTIALALEQGKLGLTEVIKTPKLFKVGRKTISDHRNYVELDPAGIIKKSSNVGTAKVALRLEPGDLADRLRLAGFSQDVGLSLPAEAAGRLPSPKRWSDIEQATLAYGYGLNANVLQLARAYTVFANDGEMRGIQLVRGLPPADPVRVFERGIAPKVLAMMGLVTEQGGTATQAKIPGYSSAGKTGTAIKAGVGGYSDESRRYDASFTGLFPASDPRLIISIVMHDPQGDQFYGGNTAAPAFADITREAARILNIRPDQAEPLVAKAAR